MEHILPAKTIAQVLNTTVTLSWGAPEFGQAFSESIIKYPVAMRLSCSTSATQAVFIGVRYETLTKTYRVAERQTIAQIPASGSVEITPAGVAALGLLKEGIISITVELTAASTGTSTIVLIIDDDPPPLSNDAGAFRGLDAANADSYLPIKGGISGTAASGFSGTTVIYTVPLRKRFILLTSFVLLGPTPSYPGTCVITFSIFSGLVLSFYSKTDEFLNQIMYSLPLTLLAGDVISMGVNNGSGSNVDYSMGISGNEIF
jgi:hypothetical protein